MRFSPSNHTLVNKQSAARLIASKTRCGISVGCWVYLMFSFIKAYRTKRFVHLIWEVSVLKMEILRKNTKLFRLKREVGTTAI